MDREAEEELNSMRQEYLQKVHHWRKKVTQPVAQKFLQKVTEVQEALKQISWEEEPVEQTEDQQTRNYRRRRNGQVIMRNSKKIFRNSHMF